MSKLFDLLDIAYELKKLGNLIVSCEETVKDAERALKKDPESEELKNIRDSHRSDVENLLRPHHNELNEKFETLLEAAKKDSKFLSEIETSKVPEEYKEVFAEIKTRVFEEQGKERPQE